MKYLIFTLLINFSLFGQTFQMKEPLEKMNGFIKGLTDGCGYSSSVSKSQLEIYTPGVRELEQIKSILKYTGLPSNFKVYSANINNAVAAIIDNKRVIIYDPNLLKIVDKDRDDYWSSMSILAHEIGHHLSGHTLSNESNYQSELDADKFSGFVLYKLGASLIQSTEAIRKLSLENGSNTHPAKRTRINAIENGWYEANSTRYDGALPPPPPNIEDFEGGYAEFKTENLREYASYEELRKENGYSSFVSSKHQGIIVDVDVENNFYTVYITKSGNDEYAYPVGSKIEFGLYNPWNAKEFVGRAGLSWLDAILVIGRNIEFACTEEGSIGAKYLAYVRYLPAKRKK